MGGLMLFVLIVIGLYFLPGIIASLRGTTNAPMVWFVDFFFGWTLIGWVVALAMALGETEAEAELRRTMVVMSRGSQLSGSRSVAVTRAPGTAGVQSYCTSCGAPVGPGKFCGECGAKYLGVTGGELAQPQGQPQLAR